MASIADEASRRLYYWQPHRIFQGVLARRRIGNFVVHSNPNSHFLALLILSVWRAAVKSGPET